MPLIYESILAITIPLLYSMIAYTVVSAFNSFNKRSITGHSDGLILDMFWGWENIQTPFVSNANTLFSVFFVAVGVLSVP